MSGILRLESLTKGNTLKQGDKTPLKYRLFDADGEKLNIAGKSAQVRLVYPDFLTIGYEKNGLTVAQDDTVTFTIDSVIPSRIYHVEIIVDDKFIFPSRADESKFTVDKSSLGTETNIIEIVGVDAVVRKAVDLINDDPSLIIDEDKLVGDIISNTGIGSIEEYYQQYSDVIKELSEEKDYHSLPEIAGARGGHDTLGQRLDETTAQLAQKANVLDTRENTNTKPINVSEMDTETKSLFTGGSVAVVGEDAVGSENIKENAVNGKHITDSVAVRSLLKASEKRRIETTLQNNTDLPSNTLLQENYSGADKIYTTGESYNFILKTNIQNEEDASFRMNVRNNSNAILETIPFEYIGDGFFVILDFPYAGEFRLHLIFENLSEIDYTLHELIISEGGYPIGDFTLTYDNLPKFTGTDTLLSTADKNIPSEGVSFNDGDTTTTTDKRLSDQHLLSKGQYIFENFSNILEVGKRYTFLAKTNLSNGRFSNMFRLQRRMGSKIVESYTSQYIGSGIYLIRDVEYNAGETNRVILQNELDEDVVIEYVLIGENGIPFKQLENKEKADPYKYPLYPVWGHEYLYSWYDKIMNNLPIKMVWAGDSTTLNTGIDQAFTRSNLGKKIMTLGGYPETDVTSINAGHGTQHTGNWLGGDKDEDKRTPNGFLDEDMQENPDLYVIAYGVNDGSDGHFPELSWQERIERFDENMREGLERIRGSQYNKSPDDMAIIICTPISTNGSGNQNPQNWGDRIRPIIQRLCREYHCAFVDVLARQYDHAFSNSWSTGGDFVHPKATANADYMSMFEGLIFPRLMHK